MARYERFWFQGRRYDLIGWGDDGSAHAIDVRNHAEVWLSGVARTSGERVQAHAEWIKSRKHNRNQNQSLGERLRAEAEGLFFTIEPLRQLAIDTLAADQRLDDK